VNVQFKDITKKDFFKEKLKGGVVSFGLVKQDDYPEFIQKAIYLGLLQFYFQKEHKGTLAYFRVFDEFEFAVQNDRAGSERHWADQVKLKDGDFLEFTEIMLPTNYTWNALDSTENGTGAKQHTIFVDYDIHRPEVRQSVYRKYDFEGI
jgi:hypothetical protein